MPDDEKNIHVADTTKPPYSRPPDTPHITVLKYSAREVAETDLTDLKELSCLPDNETITWIDIDGIEDYSILQELLQSFELHPSLMTEFGEEAIRPKVEDFGTYLHVVMRMMRYQSAQEPVITEPVHLFLGSNFVISIQGGEEGDVFDSVRDRIRQGRGTIRQQGPDYLVYALLEAVIDNYFEILEEIGEVVEDLQDEMLDNPEARLLRQVRNLKQTVRYVRKSVWPLREVLAELEREDSTLINDEYNIHFRRAYEHAIQAMDVSETTRDVLSDMLDMYLSSVSNKLNQVMKTLTVITVIFMPLTFIAGVYGMNFHFMPELTWTFGYPLILGVMAVIATVMMVYFKRKDWL